MRRYTQEEFDQFPVDECGYKQCPSGGYTLIQKFPGRCSFGERCKCEFGEFQAMYTVGGLVR